MKAVIVPAPGGPERLALVDVPDPKPSEHEIVVEVRATALNRADLLQRRGLYPPPAGASDVLGLECAGVVGEVGSQVRAVKPGQRVMALLSGGGYAERAVVHERMAMPIPDSLTFEQAAAIPEAFLTANEALFSAARLQSHEWVLLHAAASGVGSAALQLARAAGAKVIATAGNEQKVALARALGADVALCHKEEDFVAVAESVTEERGVDVILDFIGAAYFSRHMRCLAVGGRFLAVGLLGGAKVELDLASLLRRRQQLLGIVMRSRSVAEKIAIVQRFIGRWLPSFYDGALHPVVDRIFPLADVASAHERMERNENLGKIVLKVG